MSEYIRFFKNLNNQHVAEVGGKNASLGEMIGIKIPAGFATTAQAYWDFLDYNDIRKKLTTTLKNLDRKEFENFKQIGENLLKLILNGDFPEELINNIKEAYRELEEQQEALTSVAVRSSATAEDLPEASFAGQHDSFMNIQGPEDIVEARKRCMIKMAIESAKKKNRKIGLCGQAPSDFPEFAQFLVEQGIDCISFNPDAIAKGIKNILKAEHSKMSIH